MKQLDKDLRAALEMYFDNKIKDAKISEDLKDKIWDMVENLVDDVQDLARETDKDIDYAIMEEIAKEDLTDERTEMEAKRENDLFDCYRQFYLTR